MFIQQTIEVGKCVQFMVMHFPLSSHLEMCLQNGSVCCIFARYPCDLLWEWQTIYFGDIWWHSFYDLLDLLWVWVAGSSPGDAVTELMRMLVDVALFPGTSSSLNRQSAVLLWAQGIHSKVMLYVANSSDHKFTLLLVFFPLRSFCKALWSLCIMISDPWK